ncbi:MAG: hypothetical protein ACREL3_09700 [Gemmatimonadales bacterium]
MTATSATTPAQARIGAREARLQADYAPLYPGISADEWQPAAVLADRVLAGRLLRGASSALQGRALTDEHFEFRGGGDKGPWGEREGFRPGRETH